MGYSVVTVDTSITNLIPNQLLSPILPMNASFGVEGQFSKNMTSTEV